MTFSVVITSVTVCINTWETKMFTIGGNEKAFISRSSRTSNNHCNIPAYNRIYKKNVYIIIYQVYL